MLVGILSDSHDRLDTLDSIIDLFHSRGVEAVIHAGDFVAPFTIPRLTRLGVPLYAVKGNNDGEVIGLNAKITASGGTFSTYPLHIELGGRHIFIQHEPFGLDAPSAKYDLIVYGHTHQQDLRDGSPIILNPGEACGWLTGTASAALYDTETQNIEIIEVSLGAANE